MDFKVAKFVTSAHTPDQWLPDFGAEVAFAGRSNVGKSSAINTITARRGLARTSKTPGRTQQIVFFSLEETRRLVDLPGYGFANVPVKLREHWGQTIEHYLSTRDIKVARQWCTAEITPRSARLRIHDCATLLSN